MFGGVSTLNLDSKGRLAIPAKHREPLSGESGGRIVACGTPEQVAGCSDSYTGRFLKQFLNEE